MSYYLSPHFKYMIFHTGIFTCIIYIIYGYIMNSQHDYLSVGLIAQLVNTLYCTGIAMMINIITHNTDSFAVINQQTKGKRFKDKDKDYLEFLILTRENTHKTLNKQPCTTFHILSMIQESTHYIHKPSTSTSKRVIQSVVVKVRSTTPSPLSTLDSHS